MGMDHPHLRWAILSQVPPSLLSLAQSIGRAGRNPNVPSKAVVFWDHEDFQLLNWMMRGSNRRLTELAQVRDFVVQENCRRRSLGAHFARRHVKISPEHSASIQCGLCDFCNPD
jgi:superfamily II DNA helicase RecQ